MNEERTEGGNTPEPETKQKAGAKTAEKAKSIAGSVGSKLKSLTTSPNIRSIRPLTWSGLVLALAFFICMFIDTVNIRWWVMLPLGAAGILLLWKQWKSTPEDKDFELKVTFIGLIALIALVLLRDAWLSSSLADIYDKARETGGVLKEFEDLIGR